MQSPPATRLYDFSAFRVDAVRRLLLDNGRPVNLSSKAFEILMILVRNCGRTVAKEQLIQTVWNGRTVEENNLTVQISALRRALGEDPSEHRYIVTVPGEGYRFVANMTALDTPDQDEQAGKCSPQSLAVLPFKIMKKTKAGAVLGMGIADALISRLASLRNLIVRPTSAVLRYRSMEQKTAIAGSELGVNFLLEGTIRQVRGRIRVHVQLVRVAADALFWTGKFDEEFKDIFAVEDSISERVAQALAVTLSESEFMRLRKRGTEDVEAYQWYLSGRYYWSQRSLQGLNEAIRCFERALHADPEYALAWSGIAQCHLVLGSYNHLPPSSTFPKAKMAAEKALHLDDRLAEAHASLAHVSMYFDWDWNRSENGFQRAVALDPHSATSHHWYGVFLTYLGRFEHAFREIRQAEELDPISLNIRMAGVQAAYFERRFEAATLQCRQILETAPQFAPANFWLGTIFSQQSEKLDDAVAYLQCAITLLGGSRGYPVALGILGHALARSGQEASARGLLARLRNISKRRYVSPVVPAFIHAGLGQTEQALKCLEAARAQKSDLLVHLGVEPIFDGLRANSRFRTLLQSIGFR
jgi:DNA-binding winged helix-turn-helix (wHTH) protein/tetratricopeptide (TPR) repeat protein